MGGTFFDLLVIGLAFPYTAILIKERLGVSMAVVGVIIDGTLLRQSPLGDSWWGRVALSTLYVAVGTALAIADRISWLRTLCYRGEPEGEARSAAKQGTGLEGVTPRSRA